MNGYFFVAKNKPERQHYNPVGASEQRTGLRGFVEERNMKARVIHTRIWSDSWFVGLSRASKIVFLYLISNESIGLTGIYECPDFKISSHTGVNTSELEECKKELQGKISFYKGWVKIVNTDKYQTFKGLKNEVAKEKELNLIPPDVRDTLSIPYRYPIDSLSNQYSVINNKYLVKEEAKEKQSKSSSINYLEDIPREDMSEFLSRFAVTEQEIKSKAEDLVNYCKSKGKSYKDYKAFLLNALKRDFPAKRNKIENLDPLVEASLRRRGEL